MCAVITLETLRLNAAKMDYLEVYCVSTNTLKVGSANTVS